MKQRSQPQDVQKDEAQPEVQAGPAKANDTGHSTGKKPLRYFTIVSGQTLNCHEEFKRQLQDKVSGLQEVSEREECDVILLFCPVVSRAGTDIKAALEKLHNIPDRGLLHCSKNSDAVNHIEKWMKPEVMKQRSQPQDVQKDEAQPEVQAGPAKANDTGHSTDGTVGFPKNSGPVQDPEVFNSLFLQRLDTF
ncbi:hypothetical protein MHYP_G00277520 [Metynnis hypsauchen]